MAVDLEVRAHQEWLGYVQPVGLVVSVPALLNAQAHVNKNIAPQHQQFLSALPSDETGEPIPQITDFAHFVKDVFEWESDDIRRIPADDLSDEFASLEVVISAYNERLLPSYVVPYFNKGDDQQPWMMLIQELAPGSAFDEFDETTDSHWKASAHDKFERLLSETGVDIGLLTNSEEIRLVYAPSDESSGHITFRLAEMTTVAGRPIFAAMHMLLECTRLFSVEKSKRLPAILEDSRKYQSAVSTQLAQQVMSALFELLRGFQAANDQASNKLLEDVLKDDPQHIYHGLLTVLLRTVFVLYAEDRNLLSDDPVFTNHYSIKGLFERLRADAGRFPDTIDQRFGAWAQLLTLFRLVHSGGQHGAFKIPRRRGYLFDPQQFPFLEGRPRRDSENLSNCTVPRVPDGVVYRFLRGLLVLEGERISYRTLSVEQIGSVYEAVMGFELEVAEGPSIAIKPVKSHGAPATINLAALLNTKPADRAKWLKEKTDQKVTGEALTELKVAESIDGLLVALDKKIARHVTRNVVPQGALVFQPSDERRRSGSHYTPRSLTLPIVRTTLEPILKALADPETELPTVYDPTPEDKRRYTKGELAARIRLSEKSVEAAKLARKAGKPHPSQILDLKICDPAMGSGAFLVETCRQLGDELVDAWHAHNCVPTDIPPDEDEVLYARRLVAQRCLYGVDKNDMAVDLAKLSLWLVTLAKDHPFTFLDHALRHGDSLVGLTRRQIIGFHWEPKKQKQFGEDLIQKRLDRATEARAKILNAREDVPYRDQEQRLAVADEALNVVRRTGDACVSAFFAGSKKKEREDRCEELFASVSDWYASGHDIGKRGPIAAAAASTRSGEHPIPPFHWEIEFPEVFSRENGGFDAFVGNPPFAGKNNFIPSHHGSYLPWLKERHRKSHGNSDLVAYFFRTAFDLLRERGCFGLLATKTIRQGDTRATALTWIRSNGGTIFSARRRYRWPGVAAVVVSIVHIIKAERAEAPRPLRLDGRAVDDITAFLFDSAGDDSPSTLATNANTSFIGSYILGIGFTFDDGDTTGSASPTSKVQELIDADERNAERIFAYIGGDEILSLVNLQPQRFIINFAELELTETEKWPQVLQIVSDRVKGTRASHSTANWWHYERYRAELYKAINGKSCVLVRSVTSKHHEAFVFLDNTRPCVYDQTLVVFADDRARLFALLAGQTHEGWAQFFGGTLEDRPRYNVEDCFESFPFPADFDRSASLEDAGKNCHTFREQLMSANNEGLRKTYNRFHDPHEQSSEILHLRELHAAMDRAVLEAYGWDDLAAAARCEFLLDYEEEDDEGVSGLAESGKKKSKKKEPWRLRWPDEFRDEVLARLLELNEQRAKEEKLTGVT